MREIDRRASDLAATQHGLVTAEQIRWLGLTEEGVRSRRESGMLVPLWRGTYRLRSAPVTRHQLLFGAVLSAGIGAVASHRAAAELWALDGVAPYGPEVLTTSLDHIRLRGVTSHRWRLPLLDAERAVRSGVPVTSPAATLLGLAAVLPAFVVERALDDVLTRRMATLPDLHAVLERHGGPGIAGTRVLRALLEQRSPDERGDSALHRRLLRELRRLGVPLGVDEHAVEVAGRVLWLDHAWPRALLGLEVDGWVAHGSRSAFDRDRERRNLLVAQGWTILQVTARTNLPRLATQIAAHLAVRSIPGSLDPGIDRAARRERVS